MLIDPAAYRLVGTATCQAFSTVSSLAAPEATSVTATTTGQQPQSPVISYSHRSSATVTGHQPQSPVISHSHRSPVFSHSHQSSASFTVHQPQSPVLGISHPSSATVTGHRRAVTATTAVRGGFCVGLCTVSGRFSSGGQPVEDPAHSFYRGGAS